MASIQKPQLHAVKSGAIKSFINPIVHMQQEIDKALHQFENPLLEPAMDLVEDKECFKLEIEMPGMDEKDIKISLADNILNISGEKSVSRKDQNKNYICREISYGKYDRSIALPQSADPNQISASFKKGKLWITIKKKQQAQTKNGHNIKIERLD